MIKPGNLSLGENLPFQRYVQDHASEQMPVKVYVNHIEGPTFH